MERKGKLEFADGTRYSEHLKKDLSAVMKFINGQMGKI